MLDDGSEQPASFLTAYVKFMTTPGSHNDTYAETYHRMFFKNLQQGKAPSQCADDDGLFWDFEADCDVLHGSNLPQIISRARII